MRSQICTLCKLANLRRHYSPLSALKPHASLLPPYGEEWSYPGPLGPQAWHKAFPTAKGVRQSPIDIRSNECLYDSQLANATFQFNYFPNDCEKLLNNGGSWQVAAGPNTISSIKPSFLVDEFRFAQMHAHWGSNSHNGSEHLVGGLGYAAEIHIVHWNLKYGNIAEALKHGDGLLVLGIFVDEGLENFAMDKICKLLAKIPYKNDELTIEDGFDLKSVLPETTKDFWYYEGSLTTPPCSECVSFAIFRNAIPMSSGQLGQFRLLNACAAEDVEQKPEKIIHNVRPVQPLNSRVVKCSFQKQL